MSQVSDRGQITIERSIRDQLGIEPGMVAYQSIVDGRLAIVFLPAPHRDSLYGALKSKAGDRVPRTADEINTAVREALAEKHSPRPRAGDRRSERARRGS